tara:strand:+ start:362 stop:607 length:246 start_codon:yes stop_codon:yes gene_type:complete
MFAKLKSVILMGCPLKMRRNRYSRVFPASEYQVHVPTIWRICVEKMLSNYVYEYHSQYNNIDFAIVDSKDFQGSILFRLNS